MVNPSTTVIHSVAGLAFDNVEGTTTTTVARIIVEAQADIKTITGTTSGAVQDRAIRNLAAAFTTQNAISQMDPNSGNQVLYMEQRDLFIKQTDNALRLIGKSLDGVSIKFDSVNP